MIPINRRMNEQRAIEILNSSEYAVLSTSSKDGIPYGVAINYYYAKEENCLYFHTKKSGTKMENIKNNPDVSLFILGDQKVIPDRYITHYESVVVTGKACIISAEDEIRDKLLLLCNKFAPDELERREEVIEKYMKSVGIVKIFIENVTGKKNEDY